MVVVGGGLFCGVGIVLGALGIGLGTARVKGTASGRGDGGRGYPLLGEWDPSFGRVGVGGWRRRGPWYRGGGHCRRVRRLGHFHDAAQVHDGDGIGDVLHHLEIVRDKEIGQSQLLLQGPSAGLTTWACTETSRAENRFVTDDKGRFHRQGAGNADALTFAHRKIRGGTCSECRREVGLGRATPVVAFGAHFSFVQPMDIHWFG